MLEYSLLLEITNHRVGGQRIIHWPIIPLSKIQNGCLFISSTKLNSWIHCQVDHFYHLLFIFLRRNHSRMLDFLFVLFFKKKKWVGLFPIYRIAKERMWTSTSTMEKCFLSSMLLPNGLHFSFFPFLCIQVLNFELYLILYNCIC